MIFNSNLIVQYVVQIENIIIAYVNVDVKLLFSAKKIIVRILTHAFVRISIKSKYLKIIADTIVTGCDEIITFMDRLLTKNTNTIATNVTSTVSINWHSKKVRDCFILRTVSVAIILIITITCCYYSEQKGII